MRGSSIGVSEALSDIACKKGYTNQFRFDLMIHGQAVKQANIQTNTLADRKVPSPVCFGCCVITVL